MATVQSTIPFKARKLKYNNGKKLNDKEKETEVIVVPSRPNTRKRRLVKNDDDLERSEKCSPTKASKKAVADTMRNCDSVIVPDDSLSIQQKNLKGREKEIEFIVNFLSENLTKEESASLYISGQPGTGKTASLTHILELQQFKKGYKQVYVNCVMAKSPGGIYERICDELRLKTSRSSEKAHLAAIEKYLSKKHKMTLLVLDEIDYLESKSQEVLYSIFEWASRPHSRLVLVGVANALDLTERALPRLQTRGGPPVLTMHFAPYTKQQILDIFLAKLADEDKGGAFSPVALQLLAAKMAAISGDMRRTLDIGRRVIELARRNQFSENQSVETMLADSAVTVELKQVLEVLNEVYGGAKKMDEACGEDFPIQQKLILGSFMLMLTKGRNKDITLGKLFDIYKRVAAARNIAPLAMSDFVGACALIEVRGAVRVCGRGAARTRRLQLQWDESELTAALRDKALLAAILNDVACLS